MARSRISLEQTLHGYTNGHHLLASSIKLTDKSNRKMVILSDLSGPEMQSGFYEYCTGYMLAEENKIVFSYTWYADEMERPGCVWTHSLLIEPNDLRTIGNDIHNLLSFFNRPKKEEGFQNYSRSIILDRLENNDSRYFNESKLKYIIWAIFGNKAPSIISAENANDFINEIVYIWSQQNNDLINNFSFSTGSLAIREFQSEILDFQVIPKRIVNSVLRKQDKLKVLREISEIRAFPIWVEKAFEFQLRDEWSDLNVFRKKFGNDYLCSEYFVKLIKVYIGTGAEMDCLNIVDGLNIIEKVFSETEKETVGKLFLELYLADEFRKWISKDKDNAIEILSYLLNNKWLFVESDQLEKLVLLGLSFDEINSQALVKYLSKKDLYTTDITEKEILLLFARNIKCKEFYKFTDMDLGICKQLVLLNPLLAQCIDIWKETREFQLEIIQCLKIKNDGNELENSIILTILDNSSYDFGNHLFALFGEKSVYIFLDYLLGLKCLRSERVDSIKEICKSNEKLTVNWLVEKYNQIKQEHLLILFDIFNPFSIVVLQLDFHIWIRIFEKSDFTRLKFEEKLKTALFYFPIILKTQDLFPSYIINNVLETICLSIVNQIILQNEWNKIEKLLPQVLMIHKWDKCQRLRNALRRKGYKEI